MLLKNVANHYLLISFSICSGNCGLSDIAECSSTVNDDLADSSAHQSEFKESANATQQQSEMEYDGKLFCGEKLVFEKLNNF